jgi:hypothetical protein
LPTTGGICKIFGLFCANCCCYAKRRE